MVRITKFDSDKANDTLMAIQKKIDEVNFHLNHLIEYTISWYQGLKERYGKNYPRRTEIRNFETIIATKVVEANEKLYVNREEGFIGTSLKKDEFVCNCSDIDDIIVFFKDGRYKVTKYPKKCCREKILYVMCSKKMTNERFTMWCIGTGKPDHIISSVCREWHYKRQGIRFDTRCCGSKILYFSAIPMPKPKLFVLR
jgi:topoisomerase-4 subunit A